MRRNKNLGREAALWLGRGVLDLLYPRKCPFCGKVTGKGICENCRERIPLLAQPRCMKCGKPVEDGEEYCYDCRHVVHHYDEGRSLWLHRSPVSDAVYAMKYRNLRIYGEVFGKELAVHYGSYLRERGVELLVPVPLHPRRRRQRGYNQAEILSDVLGKEAGIPVDAGILARRKETIAQKQLDSRQRKINIKGAFVIKKIPDAKRIAVIDDIYTTGSTIDEAAFQLKKAGAEKVYFLTISIGQGI